MKLPFILFIALFCFQPAAWAQTAGSSAPAGSANSVPDAQVEAPRTPQNPTPNKEEPKYYLEIGESYSRFTPAGDSWKGLDARLIYNGFKRFTPFGGISTQGSSIDAQQNFGIGSYVTINKQFYTIIGFSIAPNALNIYYPRYRYDIAGLYGVPKVKGLVLSSGFTQVGGYQPGDGGRIFSVGSIYYHGSNILSGSINFNESLPVGQRSVSGSFGIMHGAQGKYWLCAGASGGKVEYSMIQNITFDVHYNTIGNFVSYQKWLSKRFGFIIRYDYQRAIGSFGRHSIRPAIFANL